MSPALNANWIRILVGPVAGRSLEMSRRKSCQALPSFSSAPPALLLATTWKAPPLTEISTDALSAVELFCVLRKYLKPSSAVCGLEIVISGEVAAWNTGRGVVYVQALSLP